MNKQTADDAHIRLGDTISLDLGVYGQDEWKVVGLYRVFLMFGGGFSTDAIYAPRQAVYRSHQESRQMQHLAGAHEWTFRR